MNVPAESVTEFVRGDRSATPSRLLPLHAFYWCVRRELWENRSIYIAPIAVAALFIIGFTIGAAHVSDKMREIWLSEPARQSILMGQLYDFTAIAVIFTSNLVGLFYCLDALYGERRDRSILFWKSLPVSNITTVLAKASIPLLVLPLVGFFVILIAQLVLQQIASVALLAHGISVPEFRSQAPVFDRTMVLLYGQVVIALWYAPLWAWLLMVSAWAQRMTFLWALLPPLGLCIVERVGLGTTHFPRLLGDRLAGGFNEAFTIPDHGTFLTAVPAPMQYLSTPALWGGLCVAAAFLAVATWLRRNRAPI